MKQHIWTAFLLLTLCSCANYKDVPYLQNSREFQSDASAGLYDMVIRPQDELNIFVFATDKKLAAQFNQRERTGLKAGQKIGQENNQGGFYYYLVDVNGDIEFPLVGKIRLSGLTIEQANATVRERLAPYFNDDAGLIVNTVMRNYYVSVLGEVKTPNTFTVSRPKVTVLEALAMAGDMTIYGRRDRVKLLREMDNGEYEIPELDLRDANTLNSPYYYMQQRDVLYVEPNEVRGQSARLGRTRELWLRGTRITISMGSLLYRVLD